MRHPPFHLLLALATFTACGVRNLGDEADDSTTGQASTDPPPGGTDPVLPTTSGGDATSDPISGTTGTEPGTGAASVSTGIDSAESSGCSFICEGDLPPNNDDCPGTHQLDPDCPAGHKCTLEGSFGNTQCVEISPNPKGLYEPCTAEGDWLTGIDDCGLGMICWNVDEQGHGTCFGMCDGEADGECVCADPLASPSWCQECAVGLCIPDCDPLLQDCPNDDLCIANDDKFLCVIDASGEEGQLNDPCEFANACDEGLLCLTSEFASAACDQNATGCCQPICNFPGTPCPNPDQQCVAWYDDPVPGTEHIGVCAIPQ